MYFRNKFDEEFYFLADNISPKGGTIRLDEKNPLYFIIEKPAFDEAGRPVFVKPLLLYNKIATSNLHDKIVEDWVAICKNKKDTIIKCSWVNKHDSEQNADYICDAGIKEVTGDIYPDPDYDYEDV